MESQTSIWTVSPEVDLVSFDGAMVIFRVNGLPKKSNVAKSREAYEQFYGTKEYWGYYEKYVASGMVQSAPFRRPKTELDKLIEKARWENEHASFYRLFHRWTE